MYRVDVQSRVSRVQGALPGRRATHSAQRAQDALPEVRHVVQSRRADRSSSHRPQPGVGRCFWHGGRHLAAASGRTQAGRRSEANDDRCGARGPRRDALQRRGEPRDSGSSSPVAFAAWGSGLRPAESGARGRPTGPGRSSTCLPEASAAHRSARRSSAASASPAAPRVETSASTSSGRRRPAVSGGSVSSCSACSPSDGAVPAQHRYDPARGQHRFTVAGRCASV